LILVYPTTLSQLLENVVQFLYLGKREEKQELYLWRK